MSAHVSWLQAEAAVDRQNWEQAERLYHASLAKDPRHVPSLIGLSVALSRRGAHVEARKAALAAFDLCPQHPSLLWGLAQRLRYFNEFERVERCLSHPAFASGAPPAIVVKGAVMLSSIGAHEAAVGMADAALRREPGNAAANYFRGNLHLFSGEPDAAETHYERALATDPANTQAMLGLVLALTHLERTDRAIEVADHVLQAA